MSLGPKMGEGWLNDLLTETLNKSGKLRFRAFGRSMLPFIIPGDVLTVETTNTDEISVGDIILFESENVFFVHRLIKKSKINNDNYFVTKGDYLDYADNPIRSSQILGRVTKIERWGKIIKPDSILLKPLNFIIIKLILFKDLMATLMIKLRQLKGHRL